MDVTDITNFYTPISLPQSISPVFLQFDFSEIFSVGMLIVILFIIILDIFDTMGALVGVATRAGLIDKNGNIAST
jgi:AGZA family xanthine/uracil permease-like MFS transporter